MPEATNEIKMITNGITATPIDIALKTNLITAEQISQLQSKIENSENFKIEEIKEEKLD